MGFLEFGLIDFLDILAVAVVMFYVYRMAKGTNAPRIITGIITIYILWIVTRMLDMELMASILGNIIGVGVVALIVVFQPEIRQFLQTIGMRQQRTSRGRWWRKLLGWNNDMSEGIDLDPLVSAAINMSCTKTGALIVIQQDTDLGLIIESGITVEAQTSAPLLENIFFKNAPLHDGAVVIRGDKVVAAKCVLPSTRVKVPKSFGMRHRAALGMSEISDAVILVVSEETGGISIARDSDIKRNIPHDKLQTALRSALQRETANQITS